MSNNERQNITNLLTRGLELAKYRTLLRKAMLNEKVVQSDEKGNPVLVSARDVFVSLYHEPVPTF